MLKLIVSSASLAIGIALPATAAAQGAASGGTCPPGSWFCAQDSQQQATPQGQAVKPLRPLPDPEDEDTPPPPPPPPTGHPTYDQGGAPPPVVVYQPPPPVMVVRPEAPPPYDYPPPPPPGEGFRHRPEWGLNLHLEGATIGHGTGGDASMGGGGLGLRLKPTRYFGIETDVDFVGGTDYQGDNRNETAVTFNGLFFLNPRSRFQLYLLAGFGWSSAHVTSDTSSLDAHYGYFGGQIGAGLEFRVSRNFALNVDLRGFLRGRTDQLAQSQPEFTSADGRTTNTSGGGLFTAGMTIYF
jgi:opacity protein-like surface antigen